MVLDVKLNMHKEIKSTIIDIYVNKYDLFFVLKYYLIFKYGNGNHS